MRDIRFRAWTGELMVTDGLSMVAGLNDLGELFADPKTVHYGDKKSIVFMQYTGLKDKNGVEIFEGDVVTDGYHNKYGTYAVAWDADGACWAFNSTDGRELEVLGNIYENPALLTAPSPDKNQL